MVGDELQYIVSPAVLQANPPPRLPPPPASYAPPYDTNVTHHRDPTIKNQDKEIIDVSDYFPQAVTELVRDTVEAGTPRQGAAGGGAAGGAAGIAARRALSPPPGAAAATTRRGRGVSD